MEGVTDALKKELDPAWNIKVSAEYSIEHLSNSLM
jgi:hypothetical protein